MRNIEKMYAKTVGVMISYPAEMHDNDDDSQRRPVHRFCFFSIEQARRMLDVTGGNVTTGDAKKKFKKFCAIYFVDVASKRSLGKNRPLGSKTRRIFRGTEIFHGRSARRREKLQTRAAIVVVGFAS